MMKTRTLVHSMRAQRRERLHSEAAANRALACVQLGAQLFLWITFFGYDRAMQAVWQAALMGLAPLLLLWFVWQRGAGAFHLQSARYVLLALLPCLMLDAAFLLYAFSGYIGQLIPQYPGWTGVWAAGGFALITAFFSRTRGAAYGADLLKGLLVVLFLFATVFLRQSSRADRLWPILGRGFQNTFLTAVSGAGSLWGTALLSALAEEEKPKGKTVFWALIPWGFSCIWALWYGFLRPWAFGDVLSVAEKMMGFARHASSVTLYEMAGLLWMVLLPVSLAGALAAGEKLAVSAFPKCPRILPLLGVLLPGWLTLLIAPEKMPGILEAALPWRFAVSLASGIALTVLGRRKEK